MNKIELNDININKGFPLDFLPESLRVGSVVKIKWLLSEKIENVLVTKLVDNEEDGERFFEALDYCNEYIRVSVRQLIGLESNNAVFSHENHRRMQDLYYKALKDIKKIMDEFNCDYEHRSSDILQVKKILEDIII